MPFEPVNFSERRGGVFITIDKQKRLMLSSEARKIMNISDLLSPWVAVYYDVESHIIAIQKHDLVKSAPAEATTKIDKRGYFRATPILTKAAIADEQLPVRFYYDGDVSIDGQRYLAFKMERNNDED